MAFTQAELDNIANAALDYYERRQPHLQSIQNKPILREFEAKRKNFPGGKENIDLPVKGDYSVGLTGYTHDDTVSYVNPANIKRVKWPWRETHGGIGVTHTELKKDGLSVVDSARSEETSQHSQRELTVLVNLLEDKFEDMEEGQQRALNLYMLRDGTADAKGFAGLLSFLSATPTTGTTGGLDRAVYSWWRNRYLEISKANDSMPLIIQAEIRQLRRFGARPNFAPCGDGFLKQLEKEVWGKGNLTLQGWSKQQNTDIEIATINHSGVKFEYDPTFDDEGLTDECFILDTNRIYMYAMEDEWGKRHAPARPHDKYIMYRARTYTGQMVCQQLNGQGRYKTVA